MSNLSNIGRVFYGIAIAEIGLQTIYYHDFPYMLIPPHSGFPGLTILAYIFGSLFVLAGAFIVLKKNIGPVSLLLGGALLLIFCFYFVPYEFLATSNYIHFGEWENAMKELALAGGAFVVANCYPAKNVTAITRFLGKLVPIGVIIFAITIISFSIDHFLYAKEASGYMPSWIAYPVSWIYFAGVALLAAGIAMILKIKACLAATLLGAMIFTWFIMLHIPKVIAAPDADRSGELVSAFLALGYCGIAFVIAGNVKKHV